ncbi:hyphal wall protein 2-like isoform X4 [Perca fluviatilis]|uniref:hyphal wall protein 2-like isoform X4 n=1 Tax=Perca fluviatilis TaxID=8168 RepID=UPI0019637038|nr:hyphal wall protein 2-like isoform X4 [Perca fluviatilis]
MAERLLFVILMYSFHEVQAHALLPPKLTVNPAVITATETVTLNCQSPSSVSVSQCYFYTLSGGTFRDFSCLQTLTGTELLKMSHQSLPAEVQVKCYYTVKDGDRNSQSPHSDTSSITIHALLPPKLTVNPPVITETDSVTLNCQTPSSVSVSQCYLHILSEGTVKVLSCPQTLTGTKLLKMANKKSSAEVKVKCYYFVNVGEKKYPSPHSDTSSITIHNIVAGESSIIQAMPTITMTTDLTDSSPGVSTTPVKPAMDIKEVTQTMQSSTMTTGLTVSRSGASTPVTPAKPASGHLTVGSSNTDSCISTSLTPEEPAPDIVERESSMTPTMPTFSMTKGLTVSRRGASTLVTPVKRMSGQTVDMPSNTGSSTSTYLTPVKQAAAETWILKFVAVMTGCGVIVGVILLVSAILCNKKTVNPPVINETDSVTLNCQTPSSKTSTSVLLRRNQQSNSDSCRPKVNVSGLLAGYDETYSIVTYGSTHELLFSS